MKFIKKNKLIIIILVLCIGFFCLIGYTKNKGNINILGDGVGIVLNPIQKVLYKTNLKIRNFTNFVFGFGQVKKDNVELSSENSRLKNQLIEYDELKRENKKLREMLDYRETKSDYNYILCDIVNISGNSYLEGYVINNGKNKNIKRRMVAITPEGLVGQVTSVGSNRSIVQTLGNENISVAAYNQRSKENNGIVKGWKDDNNNVMAMIEMSNLEADLKEGDTILTSGLGDIYPKGINIGKVIKVEEDKGKFVKRGIIKPAVNINKLEELFIVVPKDEREVKY